MPDYNESSRYHPSKGVKPESNRALQYADEVSKILIEEFHSADEQRHFLKSVKNNLMAHYEGKLAQAKEHIELAQVSIKNISDL